MWENQTLIEITLSILAENMPKISVVGIDRTLGTGATPSGLGLPHTAVQERVKWGDSHLPSSNCACLWRHTI
jgi:hypothetical protein